jgi:hypothetical protein
MVKKRDDHGGARKAAPNRRPLAGQSLLQIHLLSTRYSRRAGSCTSIPLDTLLARLVTAPPGTEMIKHDLVPLHKSERSNSTSAADATISA